MQLNSLVGKLSTGLSLITIGKAANEYFSTGSLSLQTRYEVGSAITTFGISFAVNPVAGTTVGLSLWGIGMAYDYTNRAAISISYWHVAMETTTRNKAIYDIQR